MTSKLIASKAFESPWVGIFLGSWRVGIKWVHLCFLEIKSKTGIHWGIWCHWEQIFTFQHLSTAFNLGCQQDQKRHSCAENSHIKQTWDTRNLLLHWDVSCWRNECWSTHYYELKGHGVSCKNGRKFQVLWVLATICKKVLSYLLSRSSMNWFLQTKQYIIQLYYAECSQLGVHSFFLLP